MKSPSLISTEEIEGFEKLLGYQFQNRVLLIEALTHASKGRHRDSGFFCNERLEFLGDRVLGLVIAERLYQTFPSENVGSVAARFARLVDRDTLHAVAMKIQLERYLRYVHEHGPIQGRRTVTPLADACEAVIGALYLDGGLEAARTFVHAHWSGWIDQDNEPQRDAKSKLQEWAQARGLPRPAYREVSRTGPAHLPVFVVEVVVEGFAPMVGEGYSKREAEQVVAARLLALITEITGPRSTVSGEPPST